MPVVYLLTNTSMPGLVKIGRTDRTIEERLKELSSVSGVPLPFECFLAVEVDDASGLEKALHQAFADHRMNPKREFFSLSPDKPAAIMKLFNNKNLISKDVTPKQDVVDSPEEQEALNKEREKRSAFRFSLVEIKPGSELQSVFNPDVTCIVKDDRYVLFRERELTITASALEIAKETGRNWKSIQGSQYWTYNGKTLQEIRLEFE